MKDKTIITVVLTGAVTALIAIGIISFTNFQKEKFRTEMEARQANAATAPSSPVAEEPTPAVPVAPVPAVVPPPAAPIPTAPATAALGENELFAGQGGDASISADDKFAQMQAEYQQMQVMKDREAAMMSDIQKARATGATPSFSTGDSTILGSTSTAAPTAAPAQQLTRFQEEIKNEAAIAKITHYDEDLNFLVMDGGQDRNIQPGQKFAVRSGHDIVGYVMVEEVTLNESIAKLVSKNKDSVTARKPQLGDELISYDRFAF